MYRIQCESMADFIEVIASLIERGVGFKAESETFVIYPTGAF